MYTIAKTIMESFSEAPEGKVFSAKEFLHIGSRAAIDQSLSRLAKEGTCLRVGRGRYALPVQTRFGTRAPSPELVVKSLAEANGEIVAPSGAAAANELGLTTQVPVRSVFLTSGPSRCLNVGGQIVELKKAPGWQLRAPNEKAGNAIRALAWLGRIHAREATQQLWQTLSRSERENLLSARANLPTWLAETLSEAVLNRETASSVSGSQLFRTVSQRSARRFRRGGSSSTPT